jgi:hypothetical protein
VQAAVVIRAGEVHVVVYGSNEVAASAQTQHLSSLLISTVVGFMGP